MASRRVLIHLRHDRPLAEAHPAAVVMTTIVMGIKLWLFIPCLKPTLLHLLHRFLLQVFLIAPIERCLMFELLPNLLLLSWLLWRRHLADPRDTLVLLLVRVIEQIVVLLELARAYLLQGPLIRFFS